ncbi:MAG: plasmid replication protein, CyRepA1 family, partial [Oscillatoria sp. PMC 1068.18]|nr:plasmid replication protein, CyRepA1 family [Oscillatoria sp. PMC 1068.18]
MSDEIVRLNVRHLSGEAPKEELLYGYERRDIQRNNGTWKSWVQKKYRHTESGGWWCGTTDVLASASGVSRNSQWGCFKPFTPRTVSKQKQKNSLLEPVRADNSSLEVKTLKYEHPPKVSTEIFALKVSDTVSDKILGVAGQADRFWQYVIQHPEIPIIITEGAKKTASLLTAGYCAIGEPGIYGGYRTEKDADGVSTGVSNLIPQLEVFAKPGRKFIFAFDQDIKPKTIHHVNAAIRNTGRLLEEKGCKVFVTSWSNKHKGVDDLIASEGVEKFDKAYRNAISLAKFNYINKPKLTKVIDISLNQKYLGDIRQYVEGKDSYLLVVKSAKGTGKTEAIIAHVEEAKRVGQRVIILTHRIQLGQALCNRFGIDYVTESRSSETRGVFGYGLCIDSLHSGSQAKFNVYEWQDALVIIDEVDQVLKHLLSSATCKKNRTKILENFEQLIKQTLLSDAGKLIIASADVADREIDYITSLCPAVAESKRIIVNNAYISKGYVCNVFRGNNPNELILELVAAIARGEKGLIHLSAQKHSSKYSTINLEKLLREKFPELSILRIDSETVAEPGHPAYGCIPFLNEVLPKYQVVIASPSIETGVSIDDRAGHFDSVWIVSQGVQACDSLRQTMRRHRGNISRYMWAKQVAVNAVSLSRKSPKLVISNQEQSAIFNATFAAKEGALEIDTDSFPEAFKLWAEITSEDSFNAFKYRETILAGLAEEGHTIRQWDGRNSEEDVKALAEEIKATKTHSEINYQIAVSEAADISENEGKKLSDKKAKVEQERLMGKKANLKALYGVKVSPELVAYHASGNYGKLRLLYFLTTGKEYLANREKRKIDNWKEASYGKVFKPDFNKELLSNKVRHLEALMPQEWLELPDRDFRASDDDIVAVAEKYRTHRGAFNNALGLNLGINATNIQIVKKLFSYIAIDFSRHRRDGSGNREFCYRLAPLTDLQREVLSAWSLRDETAEDAVVTVGMNTHKIVPPLLEATQGEDSSRHSSTIVINNSSKSQNCDVAIREISPDEDLWESCGKKSKARIGGKWFKITDKCW